MSRMLVTGAGGFIGYHLVRYLKSRYHVVDGVDIKYPEWEAPPTDLGDSNRLDIDTFSTSDLRYRADAFRSVSTNHDFVFALAADMGGMGFISSNDAGILRNNALININTLDAARIHGVKRYLFASSACVYPEYLQDDADVTPLVENDAYPANPQDGYGMEKLFTERIVTAYGKEYPIETRIARFHNCYGPYGAWKSGREKAPAALCRKVAIAKLSGDPTVNIWGDGEQTRSFMYIDDCVKGIYELIFSSYSEPIQFGTSELTTINDMALLIADIAETEIRLQHVDGPQGVRGRNADCSLAKKELLWEPTTDLRTGLTILYNWVKGELEDTPDWTGLRE